MTTFPTTPDAPTSPTRRDFLKLGWGVLAGVAALEAGLASMQFALPRVSAGEFGGVIGCGPVDDFPAGSVTPFNEGRFYLARLADRGFLALYRRCTHLGCAVPWDPARGQFICPCHASAFDGTGQVLNAPAPRPLDRFAVQIIEGQVQVDTSRPLEREQFDPGQLVYA
ncbi:MAG: Rieske 2Fe-2S domain-containing protein [Anaerolineales bacterium]|nr:Rieske 2Fe-2S domain-containing protein [Anaerolineales bacterium]